MKKNQLITGLVVLAVLIALGIYAQHRYPFNWKDVAAQFAQADYWLRTGLGCRVHLRGFCISSLPVESTRPPQHEGSSADACWDASDWVHGGRVNRQGRGPGAALSRGQENRASGEFANRGVHCRTAFRRGLNGADFFSRHDMEVPGDEILKATAHGGSSLAHLAPNYELMALFVARYGGLALTLLGTLFLFAVRLAGGAVATFFERSFGLISKNFGQAVAHKIRVFHSGLDTMRSVGDFAAVVSLSLSMWMVISFAYFETCRAFVASPELSAVTPSKCVLLMVASGAASIIQLPVLGWFSQVGAVVVAISGILHAAPEASTACAVTLLLVTFLGIVPVGLIWAQVEHVSLRKVTRESEHAEEELDSSAEEADVTLAP